MTVDCTLHLLMPFEVRCLERHLRENRPKLIEMFGPLGVKRLEVHARRERGILDLLARCSAAA